MKQLIVTAEREIIRDLPETYEDYLEIISLQEENAKLKRQVDDYKARLGAPLQDAGQVPGEASRRGITPRPFLPQPAQIRSYVVQAGDSLYAISRKFYGDSSHIDRIFQANRDSLPRRNSSR